MVGAYRSGGDKLYATSFKQSGVAFGARAHKQRVGILDGVGCNFVGGKIVDRSKRLEQTLNVGYVFFYDYFHCVSSGLSKSAVVHAR